MRQNVRRFLPGTAWCCSLSSRSTRAEPLATAPTVTGSAPSWSSQADAQTNGSPARRTSMPASGLTKAGLERTNRGRSSTITTSAVRAGPSTDARGRKPKQLRRPWPGPAAQQLDPWCGSRSPAAPAVRPHRRLHRHDVTIRTTIRTSGRMRGLVMKRSCGSTTRKRYRPRSTRPGQHLRYPLAGTKGSNRIRYGEQESSPTIPGEPDVKRRVDSVESRRRLSASSTPPEPRSGFPRSPGHRGAQEIAEEDILEDLGS